MVDCLPGPLFFTYSVRGLGLKKVQREKTMSEYHIQKTKEAAMAEGRWDAERRERIYVLPGLFIYLWLNLKLLPDFIGTN